MSNDDRRFPMRTQTHPSLVSDRVLDLDFIQFGAVVQFHGDCVSNGSLLGIVIFDTITLLLYATNLCPKFVDTWVRSRGIGTSRFFFRLEQWSGKPYSLALRSQLSEDKWISDHVADCMTRVSN